MPAPSLHSFSYKRRKKENLPELCQSQYDASSDENIIAYKELSAEDKISKHINNMIQALPLDAQLKGDNATNNLHQVAITQTKKTFSSSACVITPCKKSTIINAVSNTAKSCTSDGLNANQDIKVYRSSLKDQEQSTKLFVRLVGEHGERAVVRVGGGWADLGVYLRHHAGIYGRRAVSDGKFEFHGVPTLRTALAVLRSSPPFPTTSHEWPSSRSELCFSAKTCANKRPTSSKSKLS